MQRYVKECKSKNFSMMKMPHCVQKHKNVKQKWHFNEEKHQSMSFLHKESLSYGEMDK